MKKNQEKKVLGKKLGEFGTQRAGQPNLPIHFRRQFQRPFRTVKGRATVRPDYFLMQSERSSPRLDHPRHVFQNFLIFYGPS